MCRAEGSEGGEALTVTVSGQMFLIFVTNFPRLQSRLVSGCVKGALHQFYTSRLRRHRRLLSACVKAFRVVFPRLLPSDVVMMSFHLLARGLQIYHRFKTGGRHVQLEGRGAVEVGVTLWGNVVRSVFSEDVSTSAAAIMITLFFNTRLAKSLNFNYNSFKPLCT